MENIGIHACRNESGQLFAQGGRKDTQPQVEAVQIKSKRLPLLGKRLGEVESVLQDAVVVLVLSWIQHAIAICVFAGDHAKERGAVADPKAHDTHFEILNRSKVFGDLQVCNTPQLGEYGGQNILYASGCTIEHHCHPGKHRREYTFDRCTYLSFDALKRRIDRRGNRPLNLSQDVVQSVLHHRPNRVLEQILDGAEQTVYNSIERRTNAVGDLAENIVDKRVEQVGRCIADQTFDLGANGARHAVLHIVEGGADFINDGVDNRVQHPHNLGLNRIQGIENHRIDVTLQGIEQIPKVGQQISHRAQCGFGESAEIG